MAQEEQKQFCSNSSSGGGGGVNRSSKKMKQKKIPQRGLGVAQLERLRIEEQQKKDAENVILLSPSAAASTNSSLAVPFINYPHNPSSASIPFHPPSPTNLPSPNSEFRPAPPLSNIENFNLRSLPPLSHSNIGGFDVDWPSLPVPTSANFPKMWHPYEFNEGENSKLDPRLPFRSNVNLPYENSSIGPLPDLMPRAQPYQQPPLVNASLISSSSLLSFQIEPPSNQSYYSTYASLWQQEEKMVGMKRLYPFPLHKPPVPPFLSKFPTISHPVSGSDESSSCGNGSTFNLDNVVPVFREVPPYTRGITEPSSKKICRENGISSGEFLTLAPPVLTSPYPTPRFKSPSAYISAHNQEFYNMESFPCQGTAENPAADSVPGGSNQRSFFRFIPPSKVQLVAAPTNYTSCNSDVRESVDLNLKL